MRPFTTPQALAPAVQFGNGVRVTGDLNRVGHTSKPYLVFEGSDITSVHSTVGEAQKYATRAVRRLESLHGKQAKRA